MFETGLKIAIKILYIVFKGINLIRIENYNLFNNNPQNFTQNYKSCFIDSCMGIQIHHILRHGNYCGHSIRNEIACKKNIIHNNEKLKKKRE